MADELPEWYLRKREAVEAVFARAELVEDARETFDSPSGNYRLTVDRYSTSPTTWPYTRGVVTRTSDGAVVADVRRNFGSFWHRWVSGDDGEWMLCGEDYQGYSVVDLGRAETRVYIHDEAESGHGFCWTRVTPSPDGRLLAVDGCVWAGPYVVRVYDFRAPDRLPLPVALDLGEMPGIVDCEFLGWRGDDLIEVGVTRYLDEAGTREETTREFFKCVPAGRG